MSLTELTALELSEKLARKEVSSVEATRASLARVAAVDGRLNAFLRVDEEGALKAAEASDARRASGETLGPLDGVPIGVKDALVTEGLVTTAGSRILESYVPPYDATVVRRLREAGLPIVGKLNQDEFAMGSSSENSAYGAVKNPWDTTRTPGGSSGGSSAAVAAREVPLALGSDTGGSIRQPASLTGIVGLKPTWGRVSRHGLIAFASSLDQVGPMARTVADTAALLQILAGADERDQTSSREPVPDFSAALERGVEGMTFGLPREYFVEGIEPAVEKAVREAAAALENQGARIEEISLPHTRHALATYYLLAPAEASSNLARFDGIRYGLRVTPERGTGGLKELYGRTRDEGFGAEVKRRIMLGTFALSAGYYDAYYLKAQKVRTLIQRDFTQAYEKVDAILSPVSPVTAFPLGERLDDPLKMYLVDVFTLPASLAGVPGLSLPCGFDDRGLPIGLQILGKPFDEATVLRVGRAYEREHDLHRKGPAL